jgi:hypothetical protein
MFKQVALVALFAVVAYGFTEEDLDYFGPGAERSRRDTNDTNATDKNNTPVEKSEKAVQPTVDEVAEVTGTVTVTGSRVTFSIEGDLSKMSEADIETTKSNIQEAFLLAANGAIKAEDIESITLEQAKAGSRARRAGTINVIITLKDSVDASTIAAAAAKEIEFEVVVGGVATKVKVGEPVTQTQIDTTVAQSAAKIPDTTVAPSGKKGKKAKDGKSKKSKKDKKAKDGKSKKSKKDKKAKDGKSKKSKKDKKGKDAKDAKGKKAKKAKFAASVGPGQKVAVGASLGLVALVATTVLVVTIRRKRIAAVEDEPPCESDSLLGASAVRV